ncbi:restriction endonuclease subunit S [Massilia sp. 9096]|uniref:restriction endonuclease subunit S n=1 Tax=Massilia sp. 9096 TaxID=1500894 RepID=UPI0009DE26D4|nr:restriction endonuclease subunit S [Massilia sp. 9096]
MSSEWTSGKLGDFIELKRGYDLPQAKRLKGSVPLVSSSGISDEHNVAMVKGPGVITGRYGTIGQVFYVEDDFWPLNTTLYVRDFKGNHPKFIQYFLRTIDFQAYSDKAAVPGINRNHLHEALVVMPSLTEQENIAQFLGALDDRISLLGEINTTLESIAQALFKSWFVDFDPVHAKVEGRVPEGMDEATAALFPDGFAESEVGQVPQEWSVVSLSTLMDIAGGTQPPANEFIGNMRDGYVRLIQIRDYETDAHLTYVPLTPKLKTTSREDVMIARYGASVGRICWGLEGAYNVALVRVVCELQAREFLRTYLMSNVFQARLAALSGRSAQAGFNKGDIASFKLVSPTKELLAAYHRAVWPMRETILHNRQRVGILCTLRDTLLPRLISGQLRISEAEAQIDALAA